MCATAAFAFPSILYPPSKIDRSLPLQCFSAIFRVIFVSSSNPLSEMLKQPRGSSFLLSNPAEIKINSGSKRLAFFTSIFLYVSIICNYYMYADPKRSVTKTKKARLDALNFFLIE